MVQSVWSFLKRAWTYLMSLINSNTNFATNKPIDKVVGIFEGSFSLDYSGKPTDDLILEYNPYGGDAWADFYYKIPHNFTRPVFCEMLISTDNGDTWLFNETIDYNTNSLAQFSVSSDSNNIKIHVDNFGVAKAYYKVICYWIDDYDTTNPAINIINQSSKTKIFDTRSNYRRLYTQEELTFTNTVASEEVQFTVNHNLGYIPMVNLFTEYRSGEIKISSDILTHSLDGRTLNTRYKIDNNKVIIDCYSPSDTIINPRRMWLRIYED